MMLSMVVPKLPMRNKINTRKFYIEHLGFQEFGKIDYTGYLMLVKDHIEIHFFEFPELDVQTNYGQVYIRTQDIETIYNEYLKNKIDIHPNGKLETKPWRQKEFSILDPDNNLLTFGEEIK